MQTLLQRLNIIRPDIKSFLLSVHELASEDDPVRTEFREYSGSSPDDPAQACALLYPNVDDPESTRFEPLDYVLLTEEQVNQEGQDSNFSHTGPMTSYFAGDKEVTRRFGCTIAFVDGLDTLPPCGRSEVEEEELPGCC